MADPGKRSFEERLNTWVQICGIIIAAAWGVYEFVFKEIKTPRAAPVNVSVELTMQRTGMRVVRKGEPALSAIEMRINARNPSTRTVDLLPSAFVVYGFDYDVNNERFEQQIATTPVIPRSGKFTQRHTKPTGMAVIAVGNPVFDAILKPNEVLSRTIVLYVPDDRYDVLEATVAFPTARHKSNLDAEWKFNPEKKTLDAAYYHAENGRPRREVLPKEFDELELQEAKSHFQFALTTQIPAPQSH